MITLIKKLSTITLIVFGMMSFQLQASYVMTELEATTLDVPDVSNDVDWDNTDTGYPNDDDKETVNIGFPFQFDNTIYTEVTILTNGILKFGAIERMHRDYSNEALATDEGDRFIAIYWDDLVDDAVASVTYGNLGTAPNRKFVVNWTNVKAYSNNLRYDFQVVLYENGDVRYRYNNNTSNGQSATIGLEIDDSDFIQYSFNSISVEVSFDLLFRNELLALPTPFLEYRLDELSWDGSPGEVIDSSTNSLSGRAFLGANTSDVDPALGTSIGTCNYGVFDGTGDYVEISNNGLLNFSSNFAIGVWIKIDSIPTSGLKTILSKDTNYEFHVNSSGQINWWWQTAGANQTRTFNSTSSITPGVWTHVVISFEAGDQKIFINGVESGTATYPEDTTTNTNPLQFGSDQNSSSRYFNGNIDEINIFNQGLSSIQAQELMNKTRPCSSFNLCVSSFPDGLNSHTGGDINFEQDAQLFFSPDDVLNAGSVSLDGGSSQRSCVSVECQANGLAVEPTVPPTFPDTSINTINVSVNNNSTGDIGIGENNYLNVSLGNNATLDVNAGYSDYSIDDLSIGNNGTLNLVAGTYWFNNFSAGQGLNITTTGGTARIFINNNFTLPRDAIINSPSAGSQGDASQFLLYGYNDINAERDSTFSGVIYATGNVVLERDSNYYGAITGADISIGDDTNVFFNPTAAAGLDYGDLCQAASCILGSFDITQPAYALACPGTRTQISIQAMCADGTSLKDDYSGTVDLSSTENTLSEFYASIASVSSINSTIFDGTELGQKDIYLFHQNENSALQIIASDSAIPILSTSANATDFRTSGFALENPSAFTCGESTSMKLTAIGQDASGTSCQVLTGFTGPKAIKAWYSVNLGGGAEVVTTDLSVEGQLISDQVEPAANNINLTFNSGVADIPLAYANAGQILSLNIKHDDAPYDNSVPELLGVTLNAATTSFVARPEQIELSISDTSSECIAGDASCSKFVAAGSPFSIKAEAQCVGGGLADDYQGSITFSHSLVAPLPGYPGSLSVNSATVIAADSGAIEISNQTISEVGVFDLTVQSENYFTEVIPPFTLSSIGRFYPAHFQMSLASTSNACTNFSYMGQPGVTVDFTVQAHKTGGGQVSNYKNSFAKASIILVAENDNDGGAYQARLINSSPTGGWINSQFEFTFTGNFARSVIVDGPYPLMQIGALLSDNDDDVSTLLGLDMKADTSASCGASCDAKRIGDIDVRFGQLKLSNVFGPETFALDMNVQTEYFDATGFIVNTDDSCTNLLVSNPPLVPRLLSWTDNLAVGETTPSWVSDITAGLATIQFSAAGLGNEGSVIFDYEVGSWLKTENTGDGNYTDNPFAKITFGQFRGTDRMIYWREVVRKAP